MLHCKEVGRALIVSTILVLALSGADKKKKAPDVTIVECVGHRDNGRVTFDGKVRNSGERPLNGVILLFDFFSSDKVLLTTQKGPVEEETLEPGQEASFHLECDQPPRAVRYQINAEERSGRDLRVANTGPFAID